MGASCEPKSLGQDEIFLGIDINQLPTLGKLNQLYRFPIPVAAFTQKKARLKKIQSMRKFMDRRNRFSIDGMGSHIKINRKAV